MPATPSAADGSIPSEPVSWAEIVREDVAEQVVGDDHVEALGVLHQHDHGGVHVQVVGGHVGVLVGDRPEDAVPQPARVDQHVVLVHQGHLLAAPHRPLEGVTNHPLDTAGGVHAHLVGHLERGAGLHRAADAAVQAFGALAHHHKVDGSARHDGVRQGSGDARVEGGRPQVDVVVEREAQLQQQAPLQQPGRDRLRPRRRADRAQNQRIGAGQLGQHRIGQHFAGALPALGPQVVVGEVEGVGTDGRLQHLESLGDDFGPDSVTGNDSDVLWHPATLGEVWWPANASLTKAVDNRVARVRNRPQLPPGQDSVGGVRPSAPVVPGTRGSGNDDRF